jgi:hypothetical protein
MILPIIMGLLLFSIDLSVVMADVTYTYSAPIPVVEFLNTSLLFQN